VATEIEQEYNIKEYVGSTLNYTRIILYKLNKFVVVEKKENSL